MTGYLSRVALRSGARIGALARLLVPGGEGARAGTGHRLVWSLFDNDPDARRDFLWQEEAPARFLVLSRRLPHDRLGLFEIETKPFAPTIAPGERLDFFLRANPVYTTAKPDEKGRRRHDVVMHSIRHHPGGERALPRDAALGKDGPVGAWLTRQGSQTGFELEDMEVLAYRQVRIPREERPRQRDVRFALVDLQGNLRVDKPGSFVEALMRGFGRAKAFGCGLMLVKRDHR